MDHQEITVLVLLDLSTPFDTTDHSVLLDVLTNNFGIMALLMNGAPLGGVGRLGIPYPFMFFKCVVSHPCSHPYNDGTCDVMILVTSFREPEVDENDRRCTKPAAYRFILINTTIIVNLFYFDCFLLNIIFND